MPVEAIKFQTFSMHEAPVYSLESFNDHAFFSGGGNRLVYLHDLHNKDYIQPVVNTGSTIYSIKYIPERNILLAGVSGGECML